ncbi:hypothetical protein [Cupriavidus sp. CuC1]|uniref:hypothetical protein n=1 Tax=Cupriavidus sp. CuC1 TaxID=3373131 RepID=UPI0037D7C52A
MNGRGLCKIALALVAGVAMAAGGPTLAGGRGGGRGGGGGGGGMHGGGMHGGGFHGHDGFHHDGFRHDGFRHGHGHVAFVVGGGWPGWWGYPYDRWPYPNAYPGYYAPAAQYIEQGDGSDGASANAWWYRCDQPSGYYPYIKNCPGGWQTVPAQPSP